MADITYIILPQVVKDRLSLHENVDDKLIYPEIKSVQDMYIKRLLGSNLFRKMITDIAAGTLAGNYKILMDNYLIDCICNYVMAEIPDALNYQFWNKGVSTKIDPNANLPTLSDLYTIVAKYKKRAEEYSADARKYLVQNLPSFPEYSMFDPLLDTVKPDRVSYTCPLYLGDESEGLADDYSLNNKRNDRIDPNNIWL